jgi:hypothetical protein
MNKNSEGNSSRSSTSINSTTTFLVIPVNPIKNKLVHSLLIFNQIYYQLYSSFYNSLCPQFSTSLQPKPFESDTCAWLAKSSNLFITFLVLLPSIIFLYTGYLSLCFYLAQETFAHLSWSLYFHHRWGINANFIIYSSNLIAD